MADQRCPVCLKPPVLDLTLRLSLSGSVAKCCPILPKVRVPPSSSSPAATGGGGSTSARRVSTKRRVSVAPTRVVPQEVPPPVLTDAAIESVQKNLAFRRAIARIKSDKDRRPNTNEVKQEGESVKVEPETLIDVPVKVELSTLIGVPVKVEPATLIDVPVKVEPTTLIDVPVKVETANPFSSSSNENLEAAYEIMEEMLTVLPRIATRGGVPNGREIEGILHKFCRGGVAIVCACHGYLHSPEEFVRHAGGENIANPMSHIYTQP